jgi:hypothetical protein
MLAGCNAGLINAHVGIELYSAQTFAEVVFPDGPDHNYEFAVRKGWMDLDTSLRASAVVHCEDTTNVFVMGFELRDEGFKLAAGFEDEFGTGVRVYSDGTVDGYLTLEW